jgi:hypothetical protein
MFMRVKLKVADMEIWKNNKLVMFIYLTEYFSIPKLYFLCLTERKPHKKMTSKKDYNVSYTLINIILDFG